MKKIKKIKIKVNGKNKIVKENTNMLGLIKILKIPIKKVAIELNHKIIDKKKIKKIRLRNHDRIEIVHFIGGG